MGIINKERINDLDWEARSMEIVIVNAILDLKEKKLEEIKIVFDEYLDHDLYSDSEIKYIIINGLSTSYGKHEIRDIEISLENDYMLIKNKEPEKETHTSYYKLGKNDTVVVNVEENKVLSEFNDTGIEISISRVIGTNGKVLNNSVIKIPKNSIPE